MSEEDQSTEFDPSKYDFRGLAWRSLLVVVLSTMLASIFFGMLFNFISPGSSVIVLGFTTFFGMLAPAIVIARYSPFTTEAALRLRPFESWKFLLGFVGLIACFGFEIATQSIFYRTMPDLYNNLFDSLDSQLFNELHSFTSAGLLSAQFAFSTLIIAVLPAIGEEFFFRGVFLKTLQQWMTPWKAILISSAIFAALHINPFNILPIFVLGALLATMAISSGSIYPSIIFHFLFNFASVLATFIDPSVATTASNEDLLQLPAAFGLFAASGAAVYFVIRRLLSATNAV